MIIVLSPRRRSLYVRPVRHDLLCLVAAATLGLVACSPAPAPVARSSQDPSNPNAAEGVTPAVPASAAVATASGGGGHDHGAHGQGGDQAATVYVCPMHPEVRSDKPGTCPKCNMHLVPGK